MFTGIDLVTTYLGMQVSSILGQMLGAFQIWSVTGIVLAAAATSAANMSVKTDRYFLWRNWIS